MADSIPSSPKPRRIQERWVSNSLIARSPLSGAAQSSSRFGGVWALSIDLPPMNRYQAGQWKAALFGVDGFATALSIGPDHQHPVDWYTPNANAATAEDAPTLLFDFVASDYRLRYVTAPSVAVDGAASAGAGTIDVDGLDGVGLNKGDYISFSNGTFDELHVLTADAFPNSSGEATLSIHPPLRRAVANDAAVTIEEPKGEFVFANADGAGFETDERGVTRPLTIELVEFIR